jgi:import inner membrane translocase subunit TIM17
LVAPSCTSLKVILKSRSDLSSGAWNAPRRQRFYSGLCHIRNRAPFLGGSFGLWGGIFSSVDCLLVYYRQRDDPKNAVVAGFVTGGVLAIRGGMAVAFRQAMIGGVILMVIEGVGTLMGAIMMRQQQQFQLEMQKQEMARMKALYQRGGDNPYAVAYDQEQKAKIDAVDNENQMMVDKYADSGDKAAEDKKGGFLSKAKSFSF